MIHIILPEEPVLRGQSVNGSLHISSPYPYKAREIKAVILMREFYMNKLSMIRESQYKDILFAEQDVEITPTGIHHTMSYSVPKDAPFTFQETPTKIEWGVHVLVKKSRFFSESAFQSFVVLPHVLTSESPPLNKVPIPPQDYGWLDDISIGVTHLWRLVGPFSKSTYLRIQPEKSVYSPGDTVAGSVHFSRDFNNAVLSVYLVHVKKAKALWKPASREYLMQRTTDTFKAGAHVPFSFPLSPLMYLEFETEHAKIFWKIRAIMRMPFHSAKVTESYLKIRPLEF